MLHGACTSLSRTQLRRWQRTHAMHSYKQAKNHLLALVRPLPTPAIHAAALESFRQKLFIGTWQPMPPHPGIYVELATDSRPANDSCVPELDGRLGSCCTWCGTWAPTPSPSACGYPGDVLASDAGIDEGRSVPLRRPSANNMRVAVEKLQRLCYARTKSAFQYFTMTAVTAAQPDSGAVNGTFFCYRDLGAAVSASWECCLAAQPFLAEAVIANGGQTVFSHLHVEAEERTPYVPYVLPPLFQPNFPPPVTVPTEAKQDDCRQQ